MTATYATVDSARVKPQTTSGGIPKFLLGGAVVVGILGSLLSGCNRSSGREELPDDEAMRRARAEGKTAEVAAREYYPQTIVDYFSGMDQIAVLPAGAQSGAPVNPLQTPVYQLLEPEAEMPEYVLANPVKSDNEVLGRNTWMIWCGGNEAFWDWLANNSYGSLDLLKLLDSRERDQRFATAGLINEPGMMLARAPDEKDYGLWLDVPTDQQIRDWRSAYLKRTFDEIRRRVHPSQRGTEEYRGPAASADGYGDDNGNYNDAYDYPTQVPPPHIYGLSSGVIGLRLFPNPEFDQAAQAKWDVDRYFSDFEYYSDPHLVRPYRVGMSCAFCHASFHPLNSPRDVTNPGWENISGNIGAQYLRIRAVFGNLLKEDSFTYHLLDSHPPGTIDTSLIATDNINNPNTMNSIFNVPQRVVLSFQNPQERLAATSATQPSLWSDREIAAGTLPPLFLDLIPDLPESNGNPRDVPRILVDGSDSIGAWGALARVYLNIGTYHQQWIRLHEPLIGFQQQQPFTIDDCEKHSVYWHATQLRVGALRDYFLKITPPMPLVAAIAQEQGVAPGEVELDEYIDVDKLAHGRRVFARHCIVCHSSIQPPEWHAALQQSARRGEFWFDDPERWLRDPNYVQWAEDAVQREEFWRNNYLSIDYRIPVNLVRTYSGRALATNAMTGYMWQDFSSESYRTMPSVGPIPFFDPYSADNSRSLFTPRHRTPEGVPAGGGGPGFYRVPTLISIWATAPYLHNNSLGLFNNDPSVHGRLEAFDDGIRKLLWPEMRFESSSYNGATPERLQRDRGLIWRTTEDSYLRLPGAHVPEVAGRIPVVRNVDKKLRRWFPWLQEIQPLWLPSALLLLTSFLLLLFNVGKTLRILGLLLLVAALAGFVISWLGGDVYGLDRIRPLWLYGAILLAASIFLLLPVSRRASHYLAYAALVLALVSGGLAYFFGGKLGDVVIGPIPKGTPVNLLANLNPDADRKDLKRVVTVTLDALAEIDSKQLSDEQSQRVLQEQVAPELMSVSKCPEMVMDQGHYFEWFHQMSNEDKDALIELLKTF